MGGSLGVSCPRPVPRPVPRSLIHDLFFPVPEECIPVKTDMTIAQMLKSDFSAIPQLEAIRVRARARASRAYEAHQSELQQCSAGFGEHSHMTLHMVNYIQSTITNHREVDSGLLKKIMNAPAMLQSIGVEWQAKYIEFVQSYKRQIMVNGVSAGDGKAFLEHVLVWFLDAACG